MNEWFRDENLQNPINLSSYAEISAASGLDDVGLGDAGFIGSHKLLRRGKRHDYFTSALPWPQKGPGVELPLNGNAPVKSDGAVVFTDGTRTGSLVASGSDTVLDRGSLGYSTGSGYKLGGPGRFLGTGSDGDGVLLGFGDNSQVYADLSSVTAATINSLRQAFQLQKLYERDARGGTRYTEILRSHFGVVSRIPAYSVRNILADLKARSLSILSCRTLRPVQLVQKPRRVTSPPMVLRPRLPQSMDLQNLSLSMALLSVF